MKKYLRITLAAAAAFVIGGFCLAQEKRIRQVEHTLDSIYRSALHQTREEADALALDMEKALLTTDPAQSVQLLHSVSNKANNMLQQLALLSGDQQMLPLSLFLGRLAEQTESLLLKQMTSGALSPEDVAALTRQAALCTQLSSQLALAQHTGDFAGMMLDGASPEGPSAAPQPRGLPQGDITQQEALDLARDFVGDEHVLSVQAAPGTSGALPAYGVTVHTKDLQLNLEITRQGGKVLWMMPETASFPAVASSENCRDAAQIFLQAKGFDAMQAVDQQIYDGLCVITFAPVQDEVLLYPDLLKVQVRMDTAQVVGLEAHLYWMNHTARALDAPSVSLEAARQHIARQTEVISARLCVIPHQQSERLCYELAVKHHGENYLIYIDAHSGDGLQLLKTIPLENGTTTA